MTSRADCILPNPDWVSWHPAFRKGYQFSAISSSLLDQSNGLLDCSLEIKLARFVLSNSNSDGRHKFFLPRGEKRFFLCCFNEREIGGIYTFSLLLGDKLGQRWYRVLAINIYPQDFLVINNLCEARVSSKRLRWSVLWSWSNRCTFTTLFRSVYKVLLCSQSKFELLSYRCYTALAQRKATVYFEAIRGIFQVRWKMLWTSNLKF
jgi:hypothetical protein